MVYQTVQSCWCDKFDDPYGNLCIVVGITGMLKSVDTLTEQTEIYLEQSRVGACKFTRSQISAT